jgi:peptidoglycan/LPS O-acetylase OafA/YrhL
MVRIDSRRLDEWTALWLGLAALWSLGLVAAGFFVASYSSTNGPGLTLIQENGIHVLAVSLIPFVGVVIIALALSRRQRLQKPGVGVLVWIVFGLLAMLVVLGALSIGPFISPVAVFVVLAITRVKGQSPHRDLASRQFLD